MQCTLTPNLDHLAPWLVAPLDWLTVSEYARRIHRPLRTVRRWCLDGTFPAFGITVHRDHLGQWWIRHIPLP